MCLQTHFWTWFTIVEKSCHIPCFFLFAGWSEAVTQWFVHVASQQDRTVPDSVAFVRDLHVLLSPCCFLFFYPRFQRQSGSFQSPHRTKSVWLCAITDWQAGPSFLHHSMLRTISDACNFQVVQVVCCLRHIKAISMDWGAGKQVSLKGSQINLSQDVEQAAYNVFLLHTFVDVALIS